jgi:hypothetical protein
MPIISDSLDKKYVRQINAALRADSSNWISTAQLTAYQASTGMSALADALSAIDNELNRILDLSIEPGNMTPNDPDDLATFSLDDGLVADELFDRFEITNEDVQDRTYGNLPVTYALQIVKSVSYWSKLEKARRKVEGKLTDAIYAANLANAASAAATAYTTNKFTSSFIDNLKKVADPE